MSFSQCDESLMIVLEDREPPLNAALAGKYKRSFAFPSMNERAPVILTKIIDYLVRDKKNITQTYGENVEDELKAVIGDISQLKNHLQTAKNFQEFSNVSSDSELWNSELRRRKANNDPLNYYESDWLFAECYLYRRIREIFANKTILSTFDPFFCQKDQVLDQAIVDLGPHLKRLFDSKIFDSNIKLPADELKSKLSQLIKYSLWANRMDLSLSGGSTDVGIDVIDQVKHWDGNILIDDTNSVLSLINENKTLLAIDFVTDNGGLELLNDLILADFLVSQCNVKKIRFRLKPMPWYVSDVTPKDFHTTLDRIANHSSDYYRHFASRWRQYIQNEIWELSSEDFWCLGLSYSAMPQVDAQLFTDLKASPLVIFKGDLNYRKLVQDRNWEPTKPFHDTLGDFASVTLLALRTCKADTIAGLKPNIADKISSKYPNWLISGEFGLIQFNKP